MQPPTSPLESALYELLSALKSPADPAQGGQASACVVCRLATRSVERWLRSFLGEYVNDPVARETLRRAQGFCGEHTRLLAGLGDALAIAILYSDLARLTRERWEQVGTTGGSGAAVWRKLRGGKEAVPAPLAPCPACIAQQEAEVRYARALADGLDRAEVREALEAATGLCAPHVTRVLVYARPADAAHLRQLETQRLTDLQTELEAIIRKNDHRFRGEAWGAEKDAWRRALDKLKRDM